MAWHGVNFVAGSDVHSLVVVPILTPGSNIDSELVLDQTSAGLVYDIEFCLFNSHLYLVWWGTKSHSIETAVAPDLDSKLIRVHLCWVGLV